METVIIETRTKKDVRFLLDFSRRIGVKARTVDALEDFEDECLISMIDEAMKEPSVSMEEVMNVLKR